MQFIQVLKDEFEGRCRKNANYSLRAFARSLSIDPSTLSGLLREKRPVTIKTAHRLLKYLNINTDQKTKILGELAGLSVGSVNTRSEAVLLQEQAIECLVGWEHFAILSLVETKGFRPDVRYIAAKLGIGTGQVMSAVERLMNLGLLEKTAQGWRKVHKTVTTTEDIPSKTVREGNAQCIHKALDALEAVPLELREITGITLAITTKKLSKAKDLIRRFRKKMEDELEVGEKDCVYRLNIQFFPLQNGS